MGSFNALQFAEWSAHVEGIGSDVLCQSRVLHGLRPDLMLSALSVAQHRSEWEYRMNIFSDPNHSTVTQRPRIDLRNLAAQLGASAHGVFSPGQTSSRPGSSSSKNRRKRNRSRRKGRKRKTELTIWALREELIVELKEYWYKQKVASKVFIYFIGTYDYILHNI